MDRETIKKVFDDLAAEDQAEIVYLNSGHSGELNVLEVFNAGQDTDVPPPRQWLLGNQFCRGFLSSLVAPTAVGKTAVRMAQYISLAIARALTGQHIFKRSRVLLLSLEDGRIEVRRRVLACCLHHHVHYDEIDEWLYYATPKGLKLADLHQGSIRRGDLDKQLRIQIDKLKPDLVALDPFVKTHHANENDNGQMDFVCDLLATIADDYNIAVDAPHHARKGSTTPGDVDSGRGASSIPSAARIVDTLTKMSEDEAKQFGIDPLDRRWYIRLDNAKANIAPPSLHATWFKLVSVRLDNSNDNYPNGDYVQTVEPWMPPNIWASVTAVTLNAVLTEIDAGLPNGQRYSNSNSAKDRAAWRVVQKHCQNHTEDQCAEIIRTWVRNGVLVNEEYDDPIEHKKRKGLKLDTTKRPS